MSSSSSPAATLREARFTQPAAVTPRQMLISLKGGNLFLRKANVPEEVAPGGVVDIDTTVSNGALLISSFDPDSCVNDANPCTKGPFETGGYCYELTVSPEWTGDDSTGPTCIHTTEIGTADQDRRWTFTAPQQTGDFNVTFRLEVLGSGEFETLTRSITVTEEAPPRPGPGDGDEEDEEDIIDQIEALLQQTGVVLGLLVLLALIGLLS